MVRSFSNLFKKNSLVVSKVSLLINLIFNVEFGSTMLLPDINIKDFDVNVSIDLNVDINIELHNKINEHSSTNVFDGNIFSKLGIIAQIGNFNEARISQIGQINYGLIYQEGSYNIAHQYQNGEHNNALIYQNGYNNYASQEQNGMNNLAIIIQIGIGNYAEQFQMSNKGVKSVIIQEGNFNYAKIYQY